MKYVKKPVVIEAIRFLESTTAEVSDFLGWTVAVDATSIDIPTLEGSMRANLGDWIIRGIKGELYPCKNDIFEATYDVYEE